MCRHLGLSCRTEGCSCTCGGGLKRRARNIKAHRGAKRSAGVVLLCWSECRRWPHEPEERLAIPQTRRRLGCHFEALKLPGNVISPDCILDSRLPDLALACPRPGLQPAWGFDASAIIHRACVAVNPAFLQVAPCNTQSCEDCVDGRWPPTRPSGLLKAHACHSSEVCVLCKDNLEFVVGVCRA